MLPRRLYKAVARVAHERRACIRDQGDRATFQEPPDQGRRLLFLVVLVARNQPGIDRKVLQQAAAVTRVLGRNQINRLQRVERTHAHVPQIANRGGHQKQDTWIVYKI